IVGFGLMKGFWEGFLRLFLGTFLASRSAAFPKPVIGTPGYELSALAMFIGSMFVLYYACKLVQGVHEANPGAQTLKLPGRLVAVTSLVAVAGLTAAWAISDRDRWKAPQDGTVKIGIIVPTTGPYAILGNSFVKAA